MDELESVGIKLVMVSIGKPGIGKELIQHLGFVNGEHYLFVDPENALYDDLDLNRGVQRTFFNPNTPFSFLERFTKPDGTRELGEILSKWSKAFYIPPKQSQAFLQGGTFVFQGDRTVFAHYDPSTAAHASVESVLELAMGRLTKETASPN